MGSRSGQQLVLTKKGGHVTWFYDSYSGKLVHEDPPAPGYFAYMSELSLGLGWHELNVPPDAPEAVAAAAAAKLGGAVPTTSNNPLSLGKTAAGQAAVKAAAPVGGITAIGDFFGRLTERNTWIRIAEVALGIILIAVGLTRMTHAVPIATAIAAKVP
jgi:hypothetical protein